MSNKMVLKFSLYILTALLAAPAVTAWTVCNSTQPCSTNSVCVKSAQCKSGYCFCDSSSGYEIDETGACVKPSKLVGDSCTKNVECLGINTLCSTTCQCLNTYYVVNSDKRECSAPAPQPLNAYCNSTIPTVGLFCSATAWCNLTSNLCQCAYGYKRISGNNVDCMPFTLNDTCQPTDCGPGNSQCNYNKATCDSGKFACKTGYTWMTAGDTVNMDGCYDNSKIKEANAKCSKANDMCKTNYECSICPETPQAETICLNIPVPSKASNQIISSALVMILSAISTIVLRSV